jgi:putative transposase
MIDRSHGLSVTRQARLLGLSRASVYYTPQAVPDAELAIMRRLDELHLELPFAGSRMLRDLLRSEAIAIGRAHVRTLMRRLAITAIYQRPKTTQPHPAHPVFPYLLRTLTVTRPNHVWAATSRTSRWPVALPTSWSSWTGRVGRSSRGVYRRPSPPTSASRRSRTGSLASAVPRREPAARS